MFTNDPTSKTALAKAILMLIFFIFENFSANNVRQWTVEQNKDLISIGKHLEWLMSTVNPLNEEVNELKGKNKDMATSVAKYTEQYKAERQNSGIMKKQYEGKLKVRHQFSHIK